MRQPWKTLATLALASSLLPTTSVAQTDGSARLEATVLDYTGTTSPNHYTVVWVTTQAGGFIKTLRKQGPSWTSGEWANHCGTWNTARAGSTVLDGYSTATAHNYTSETFAGVGLVTNSPIVLTWNCRDASNNLMADGAYKFWIQYAENSGQGPVTTSGLLWTKGLMPATTNFVNQGANFSNMKVVWTPAIPPIVAPNFTNLQVVGNSLVISGTGPASGSYVVMVSANAETAAAWTPIATNTCNAAGQFRFTNTISSSATAEFFRLKLP